MLLALEFGLRPTKCRDQLDSPGRKQKNCKVLRPVGLAWSQTKLQREQHTAQMSSKRPITEVEPEADPRLVSMRDKALGCLRDAQQFKKDTEEKIAAYYNEGAAKKGKLKKTSATKPDGRSRLTGYRLFTTEKKSTIPKKERDAIWKNMPSAQKEIWHEEADKKEKEKKEREKGEAAAPAAPEQEAEEPEQEAEEPEQEEEEEPDSEGGDEDDDSVS